MRKALLILGLIFISIGMFFVILAVPGEIFFNFNTIFVEKSHFGVKIYELDVDENQKYFYAIIVSLFIFIPILILWKCFREIFYRRHY